MKVFEIFSKRQKRLRGEVPDVYQYEDIPPGLPVQVIHIWREVFGEIEDSPFRGIPSHAYEAFEYIHDKLCSEYGMFTLSDGEDPYETVCNFFINTKDVERMLDVIEFSFRCIDPEVSDDDIRFFSSYIPPDRAIDKLNHRFREHRVGYQYKSGQIIKMNSEFTHSEVVNPALSFLSNRMYKGANEEFLKAHEHYRKGRHKECLNECLKAFESCLKTIFKKRSWQYDDKRSTAKDLIQIVFDNGLIPSFMQSHFSALKSTLESGLPTVRNRQSGHGQGSTQIIVPEYIAAYALHLTASNILLLAKADEEMK